MAKRIPTSERPELIRDAADWARDWGWVSPRIAKNQADRLREIALVIKGALDDEGADLWAREIERVARKIDPTPKREATKRRSADKVAAMQEP